jgi:excisionase family DNA binding protein
MTALLTTAQVAGLLAVSRRSVRLWAACGELRGFKVGRQWRFHGEAIQQWVMEREADRKIYLLSYQIGTEKHGN